jgi:CMP-N,N'-diacetyllegionaminic acid synthase
MTTSPPRVLALISARGGSKGLPRKNVLEIAGKPMIAWSILAALQAECVTDVVLSSDDDEIMDVATRYGCDVPFKRPVDLASDTASVVDVVLHALDVLPSHGYSSYDYVLLLQPTSPLRTAAHIDAAFKQLHSQNAPSCVSLCEVSTSPYLMFNFTSGSRIAPMLPVERKSLRRQDLPPVYELNGAIYFSAPSALRAARSFTTEATVGFVMPRNLSTDIDTTEDLQIANIYLSETFHA